MPVAPNIDQNAGESYRVRLWRSRTPGLPLYPFVTEETRRLRAPGDIRNHHPYFLVIFVTGGEIAHCYQNYRCTLTPGFALVVPAGTFSFASQSGYHKYLIGFKGREAELLLADFGLQGLLKIPVDTAKLLKIFRLIDRNLGRRDGGDVPEMLGQSMKLLGLLAEANQSQIKAPAAGLADTIRAKLESRVNTPLNLKELGMELGVPQSSLRRIFRDSFGVSPKAFQTNLRMRHALELLELSELSIKEIAAETGFRNQYYFSNFVKKEYGVAPVGLRARLRATSKELIMPPK